MMDLFTQTRPRWSIYGCLTMVLLQTLKPHTLRPPYFCLPW